MQSVYAFYPVVGYASLSYGEDPFHRLQEHCSKLFYPLEIFAEEFMPDECRPLWAEILQKIESKKIHLLVLPSLQHACGENLIAISDFLELLEAKNVRLQTLDDKFDTDLQCQQEIIARFSSSNQLTAKGC